MECDITVGYGKSSVKDIHGEEIVLHYGRMDLKKYLLKFLQAFQVAETIQLRVVEV